MTLYLNPSNEPRVHSVFSDLQAEALVSTAQAALDIRRRYQFFTWTQGSLQPLLPHHLIVCGVFSHAQQSLVFEVFNSLPLDNALLSTLSSPHEPLQLLMQQLWLTAGGKPATLNLVGLQDAEPSSLRDGLIKAGFEELLVHGVSRPHRPSEIESFFMFGRQRQGYQVEHKLFLELLVPHIHRTWQRVQNSERELEDLPPPSPARNRAPALLTQRERQILRSLREGYSNPEIGAILGISPLTVKNHVQKILRKLQAANRAQAVAIAIRLELMGNEASLPRREAPDRSR